MKKYLIVISILGLLPLMSFAQLDFNLDSLFNNFDIASNITVHNVDLIWSADTYAPYQYQGRNLPSVSSKVVVEAIVNASGDAKSLKYSWFLEDIFQRSKSGYAKDSFSFYVNQRPGSNHTVRLQVFNEDRSVFIEQEIKIPIVEPELIIDSKTISPGKEFSFIAKPYFFSINKLTDLTFEWFVPGQEAIISSDYDASVLDLNISGKENDEVLKSALRVSAQNNKDPRQKASQTINVLIY